MLIDSVRCGFRVLAGVAPMALLVSILWREQVSEFGVRRGSDTKSSERAIVTPRSQIEHEAEVGAAARTLTDVGPTHEDFGIVFLEDASDSPSEPRYLAQTASTYSTAQFNNYLNSKGATGDAKLIVGAASASSASTHPAVCSGCSAPNTMGPILVVYVPYQHGTSTTNPQATKAQVRNMIYGPTPSWGDVVSFSSWGQSTLSQSDVDFLTLPTRSDPETWNLYATYNFTYTQPAFTQKVRAKLPRKYNRVIGILAGSSFAATAYIGGQFSRNRGGAIAWQTIAHEVGHNWGLHHADCFEHGQGNELPRYHQYGDDALMGYQRDRRNPDFTAVARYNLGWITQAQTAAYPAVTVATIRALNEGPKNTDAYLLMTVPCSSCRSGNPNSTSQGGHIFISFRVKDRNANYGIENQYLCAQYQIPSQVLTMVDRVHIHYQSTGFRKTVLWNTLDAGQTYQPLNSSIFIHVCATSMGGAEQTARVAVSGTSAADAQSRCVATWTGPFNTDMNATGPGSLESTAMDCKMRCFKEPSCKAIRYSKNNVHHDGNNCFIFDNQADSLPQNMSFQIYKLTRQAVSICPSYYPACDSYRNCILSGCASGGTCGNWRRAPGPNMPPGSTYNYIMGYDGSGSGCNAHNQAFQAPVACPANSVGTNVLSGCLCMTGYTGRIAPSSTFPYYSGSCQVPVACPANSVGTNVLTGCLCMPGYTGRIAPSSTSPYYTGSCQAANVTYMLVFARRCCCESRVYLGRPNSVQACANLAYNNPNCGQFFEVDANSNWCACGGAGTHCQNSAGLSTSTIYTIQAHVNPRLFSLIDAVSGHQTARSWTVAGIACLVSLGLIALATSKLWMKNIRVDQGYAAMHGSHVFSVEDDQEYGQEGTNKNYVVYHIESEHSWAAWSVNQINTQFSTAHRNTNKPTSIVDLPLEGLDI